MYTDTAQGWSVNVGINSEYSNLTSLHKTRLGISRIGSGSHIMSSLLARTHSFPLHPCPTTTPPLNGCNTPASPFFDTVILDKFPHLRDAVSRPESTADFFLWEKITTAAHDMRLPAGPALRSIGHINTPWPSWLVVANTLLVQNDEQQIAGFLQRLNQGVELALEDNGRVVSICVDELGYDESQAREWLETVSFVQSTSGVDVGMVKECVKTLQEAGAIMPGQGIKLEEMTYRTS